MRDDLADYVAERGPEFRELMDQAKVDIDTTCPACGEPGEYWEDRITLPPHVSVTGFEIRSAGFKHPDGGYCTEW